ncbi:hypothetical protein B7Z17_02175 [Candidatus Saccharibacteria bacterium 32-49-10]|nr:MAG: hypothetical protein B7Z17_02175 [Candidatus Saccharibacteria bacterium 32-49-10]
MKQALNSEGQQEIQIVTEHVLGRIKTGYEAILEQGEEFTIRTATDTYVITSGWTIRFIPKDSSNRRKSLSGLRFVATSPDGRICITVDGQTVARRRCGGTPRIDKFSRLAGSSPMSYVGVS